MTKRTDKMKNLWMKIKREPQRWMFWAALLGFLASMVPVWALSFYTVPGCDDYTYGVKTHGAWKAAGTLTAVLRAALETTLEYWQEWQGTYSSIFLMTLSPGILDEKWYFLTVFLMTGMLGFGLWALLHVVLEKCAGCGSACRRGLCVLLLLFLCFQTMVAPADGLFWYNGALHYVFMQSVLFFQAAVLLSFYQAAGKGKRAGLLVLSCFLAFVLGGANLLTGLQSCILMVFFLLYVLYGIRTREGEARRKGKRQLWILLPLLTNLIGFGFNVLAPGNSVRETTAEGMGAIAAIVLSFYWAAVYVTEWMTPLALAVFLLLVPVIFKMVQEAGTRFFGPGKTVFLSFCVFAAMFTPTLYASSSDGPPRCKNIMRIVLYVLVFFNLVNALGWLSCNRPDSLPVRLAGEVQKKAFSWMAVWGIVLCGIFLLAADKNTYTSVSAIRSLANGEAAQYYEENARRLELYNDDALKDVTVSYLTAKPYLLFKADVGNEGSQDYWINISIVDYYGKDSLTVVENGAEESEE